MTTDYQEEERQVMANLDYDRSVVGVEVEVGHRKHICKDIRGESLQETFYKLYPPLAYKI